ncbi:MAG: hypothetical protein AAFX79_12210 [Planctomycetota bacterium]
MHTERRPHVSAALVQLRTTVLWTSLAVVGCAVLQMLSFCFVHFTDVRWDVLETPPTAQKLTVVTRAEAAAKPAAATPLAEDAAPPEPAAINGRLGRQMETGPKKVLGRWDGTLRTFADASAATGIVATFTLWIATLLGAVVAGGANIPGVEKTVRAATWTTVLFMAAAPLVIELPGLPLSGSFVSYDVMLGASAGVGPDAPSPIGLLASHLALPLVAAILAGHALMCFREGVEAGVIVTSVSELDEKLDKELEAIRAKGVGSHHGQRAVGTLNRPMGEGAAGEAERPKSRAWVSDRDRGMADPSPGNPLRRPV